MSEHERFIKNGDDFTILTKDQKIREALPPAIWSFTYENYNVYLDSEEYKPFRLPKKVYGNLYSRRDKIIRSFKARNRNTAVLLQGLKGSGKSLLAKAIANVGMEENIPIVKFDEVIDIFSQKRLIETHSGYLIILFDEFEKVFYKPEWQESMLSFLDGTNDCKILSVITVNDAKRLDPNLFNRPGRVLYNWAYTGLTHNQISEVISSLLENKTLIDDTISKLTSLTEVTYDIVSTVVEEMNIHGITVDEAVDDMNLGEAKSLGFLK